MKFVLQDHFEVLFYQNKLQSVFISFRVLIYLFNLNFLGNREVKFYREIKTLKT